MSLEARDGEIVIRARRPHPRAGWREAAQAMHAAGEDAHLWPDDMEEAWAGRP